MNNKPAPASLVVLAFAILYIVWGSTYFFIKEALESFPPFVLGFVRFTIAGLMLMLWCIARGEPLWNRKAIVQSLLVGVLLLFIGNGAVVVAEKTLPSSLTAIIVSSSPIWFVLLDKPMWKVNFKSAETLIGLVCGFAGVILLFYDQLREVNISTGNQYIFISFLILTIGSVSWTLGSLYSKYRGTGTAMTNTVWQMLAAALAFYITSIGTGEMQTFDWSEVTRHAWFSLAYLIVMGSLAGYSAYVWLISVRPVTQVSTYAYVNPVVAVLLGFFFAGERISFYQVLGLAVILVSILLINLSKYRKNKKAVKPLPEK